MSVNLPDSNLPKTNLIYINQKNSDSKNKVPARTYTRQPQVKQHKIPNYTKTETKPAPKIPANPLQDLAVFSSNILEYFYGTIGFGIGLIMLRKFINETVLLKLYKSFSKKVKDREKTLELALKMRKEHGLENKVPFMYGENGEAYFSSNGKNQKIVLGPDSLTAAFHELGHAVIENKTKLLKKFQDNRGLETSGAIAAYMLIETMKLNKKKNGTNPPKSRQNSQKTETLKEKI